MRSKKVISILFTLSLMASLAVAGTGDRDAGQAPRWGPLPDLQAVEDVPLTYDFVGNVSDPDTPLENLTIASTSPYVASTDGLNVTFLFPNGVLEANVSLALSDGATLNWTYVNFTVEPINDPPRWERASLPDGEQDVLYSYNLTVVDVDNALEELNLSDDTEMFEISPSGEIAFVPRNDHVGRNWFNVTVSDPEGLSDTMELSLNVTCVYDPPFPFVPRLEAYEDIVWVFNYSELLDPSSCEPLTNLTFSVDTARLHIDPVTGIITWDSPTNDDVGDFFFTVTFTDEMGRYDQHELRVRVINTNDAPRLGEVPQQVLTQGVRYTFDVPFSDDDLLATGVTETLTFTNTHPDLFEIDRGTGRIDLVPTNRQAGIWVVDITVEDLEGASDTIRVVFVVNNANDPPLLENPGTLILVEDEPFEFNLTVYDPDMDPRINDPGKMVDPGELLLFSIEPDWIPIDEYSGTLSLVPTNELVLMSPIDVIVTVRDAMGALDEARFALEIPNVPDPPVAIIEGLADGQRLVVFREYPLEANATDEFGMPWGTSFEWYDGTTLIGQDRSMTWVPRHDGRRDVILVVRDDGGQEVRAQISVSVNQAEPDGTPDGFFNIVTTICIMSIAIVLVVIGLIVYATTSERRPPRPPLYR
jgi:hypothetical protein